MHNTTKAVLLLGLAACASGPAEDTGVSQGSGLSANSTPLVGIDGTCLDVDGAQTANGTKVQVWSCNGTLAQGWSSIDGMLVGIGGKCLDVSGNLQANGTKVQVWDCNGTSAQQWTRVGSTLRSAAGLCLDASGASSADGTQIILWSCNGGPNQSWTTSGTSTTSPPTTPTNARPAAIAGHDYDGWKVTFRDELDTADTITAESTWSSGKLWFNGTDQCCMGDSTGLPGVMYPTPVDGSPVNPYAVNGGVLDITLQKKGNTWASGVMTSVDNAGKGFAQQYGYFEMRAKLPVGPGTWPGFWMLDQQNKLTGAAGGEIDILEQYGQFPHGFCTTLHDWRPGTAPVPYQCADAPRDPATGQPIDFTTAFHTVSMLWTASTMTFYVDDIQSFTTPTPDVMKQPYYLLVDLGLGGGWPTDKTPSPSVMQVDYVRAWGP